MTPRVVARNTRRPASSLEEFRSHIADGDGYSDADVTAFWRWALLPTFDPTSDPRHLLDEEEQRVLSRATNAAGATSSRRTWKPAS